MEMYIHKLLICIALIQQMKHGINLKYGMPSKFYKNEIRIWKTLLVIQTDTSVFYTIPHISWTAINDAILTVQKFKKNSFKESL